MTMDSSDPSGAGWPVWHLDTGRYELGRYIVPDAVIRFGRFPARSDDSPTAALAAIWAELTRLAPGYAYAKPVLGNQPAQAIRPPGEVLVAPANGTCLDLALVLAGACEHAGLPSAVIVLDAPGPDTVCHAVVAVWVKTKSPPEYLAHGITWDALTEAHTADIRSSWPGSALRPLVIVDPVGFARSLGTSRTVGTNASLADAVAQGNRYLVEGWTIRLGATPARDPYQPSSLPDVLPLRELYLEHSKEDSVLQLIRPEYRITPFQARSELTILGEFARRIETSTRTGLAVLYGAGGAGKTRLALEFAERLRIQGWYAGVLRENISDHGVLPWLVQVTAPLLVVVDYADTRVMQTRNLLTAIRSRAGRPALIILTARSIAGEWLEEVTGPLRSDGHKHSSELLALPDAHPESANVYARTFRRLADSNADPPPLPHAPPGTSWTTLDHVLHGWFQARKHQRPPETREELYDEILHHELDYWARSYTRVTNEPSPDRDLLRRAGAILTLLSPSTEDAADTLCGIAPLGEDTRWRHQVARAMIACLAPSAGQGVAIRPDPIGDYHVLRTLADDPGLLLRWVPAGGPGLAQAIRVLTRAAKADPETATLHAISLLQERPEGWPTFAADACTVPGPARRALEHAVLQHDCRLPLDELSASLPAYAIGPTRLGLIVDEQRLSTAPVEDLSNRAELIVGVSRRRLATADYSGALAAIDEAVVLYRRLAKDHCAETMRDLAVTLSEQAGLRHQTGDLLGASTVIDEAVALHRIIDPADDPHHDSVEYAVPLATALRKQADIRRETRDLFGAEAAIDEAVSCYRTITNSDDAQRYPTGCVDHLAGALNSQAAIRYDSGDMLGAQTASDEAVTICRKLATDNPSAFTDDLASALSSQARARLGAGDPSQALAASDESVTLYRILAGANRAVFTPSLTVALNNLAATRNAIGDRGGAVAASDESLSLCRELDRADPGTFVDILALTLSNRSEFLASIGDHSASLVAINEAVDIRRTLAARDPNAYVPDLTLALSNQAGRLAESGDLPAALAAIDEAVALRRKLAAVPPASHTVSLAAALHKQAGIRSKAGDNDGARTAIHEAITLWREVTAGYRPTFTSSLAAVLNDYANIQCDSNDLDTALAAIDEAVTLHRQLAAAHPAAHTPLLSRALHDLAHIRSTAGDMSGATDALDEAIALRRSLARTFPSAFTQGLAASLHNQALMRSKVGDLVGAQASVDEAVGYLRQLASTQPQSVIPDLGRALINQASIRVLLGNNEGALASNAEAIEVFGELADAQPGTFAVDLADALNSHTQIYHALGDHAAAVTAIGRAVDIFRGLAAADPASYTAGLATVLSNQATVMGQSGKLANALEAIDETVSLRRTLAAAHLNAFRADLATALHARAELQLDAGDHAAALSTIHEAVVERRALAKSDPAVAIPSLAASLQLMSRLAAEADDWESAARLWTAVIADQTAAVFRAELRACAADTTYRLRPELGVTAALQVAVVEAAQQLPPASRPALVRARETVRNVVRRVAPSAVDLPAWAVADLPDSDLDFILRWVQATNWTQRARQIENLDSFPGPTLRRTVAILGFLQPVDTPLAGLDKFLELVAEHGLEVIVSAQHEDEHLRNLLGEWANAPTWQDSFAYLAEHAKELNQPRAIEILLSNVNTSTMQRAAILALMDSRFADSLEDLVTKRDIATDIAIELVEQAETYLMLLISNVCPEVLNSSPNGRLLDALGRALTGAPEQAVAMIAATAPAWQANDRRACRIHLSRMAQNLDATGSTPRQIPREVVEQLIAALDVADV